MSTQDFPRPSFFSTDPVVDADGCRAIKELVQRIESNPDGIRLNEVLRALDHVVMCTKCWPNGEIANNPTYQKISQFARSKPEWQGDLTPARISKID